MFDLKKSFIVFFQTIFDKRFGWFHIPHFVLAEVEFFHFDFVSGEFILQSFLQQNIGILDDAFLAEVRNLPERYLAVELLDRLLQGEIKTRFASNLVQQRRFSELLANVITRYQNRAIETAQVIEELIEMARKFRDAANRGEQLGLNDDEVRFYDALVDNESAVRELGDETLKKIAHELTESLRRNITVDWSQRESVRARPAAGRARRKARMAPMP